MQRVHKMWSRQARRLRRRLLDLQVRFAATCLGASKYNGLYDHLPIEVRRLYVAKAFRLTRTDENHVGWNEIIALQAHDVAWHDVLPFLLPEYTIQL